jgi:hypothetical protein
MARFIRKHRPTPPPAADDLEEQLMKRSHNKLAIAKPIWQSWSLESWQIKEGQRVEVHLSTRFRF